MDKTIFLYVTHVEKEGPFLKVWGQVDKSTAINVEQALQKTTPHFEQGFSTLSVDNLQTGVLCCAKYKDNKYYRARIVGTDQLINGLVEVSFLDYGNKDVVPCHNLRSVQNFTTSFISLPPLASSFLLAEAVCLTGEWNESLFQEIVREIRYAEVHYMVVAQAVKHYCVRLYIGNQDVAVSLISRGLMSRTSLHTQEAVLLTMLSRQTVPAPTQSSMIASVPPLQAPQTLLTYKAFTLEPSTQHPVYVSYISDGPCHFSIQLKQTEDVLVKLMNDINSMPLKPIEEVPLPGTVCVARCIEDSHICRAVVTNEVDSQFKVFYVDFGNSEIVPLEALYQIPFKYVIPKVMAVRFALAGIEKSTVTLEMKCAFKQFVDNRLLLMKVIPTTTRTALPRCELLDPETKTSALDVLNKAAVNAYPEPLSLNRGFSQLVRVSYVFSCSRFFVQLKSKENELASLMMDLQESCSMNDPMAPELVKNSLPCCALFEGDGQWYRSLIVEVCDNDLAKVRYIDYGNEEVVPVTQLKLVEGEQLTVLRPQAIECCLNGYQNMADDVERDNFLEEVILEKEFTMKVVEMLQNGRALVDLIDSSNYNVASLLLDKIANARAQVSPLLVQAGNKIEHRKSIGSVPTQNYQQQQRGGGYNKPTRDANKAGWNDKTNDSTSWRQDNKDKGFRNRESQDQSNDNNWRQNKNTNFSQNNDKNRNTDWRDKSGVASRLEKPKQNARTQDDDNWENADPNVDNQNYSNTVTADDEWNDNAVTVAPSRDSASRNSDKGKSHFEHKDKWEKKSNDSWGNKGATESRGGKFGGDRGNRERRGDWNNKGDTRGDKGFRNDKKENWGNKKDDWGSKSEKTDNWGGAKDEGWGNKNNEKPFRKQRDNFEHDKENRQQNSWDAESPKAGGQRFKKNFGRENSELSSSGSERSFRKGKPGFEHKDKKFDKSSKPSAGFGGARNESWKTETVAETFDVVSNTAVYKLVEINLGSENKVSISWFHNPAHFYVQVVEYEEQLRTMMENIQQAYKSRKPAAAVVGAPVISIFPEDKVLYRAKVLESLGTTYKVFYVDFGNVATVDKVWPLETKFLELPSQAICCGLNGVEPVNEQWEDAQIYSKYFDKDSFTCKFVSSDNGRYLVEMGYGESLLSELLARDFLAKYGTKPEREVSHELLKWQYFWVTVMSMNSLDDILVQNSRGELFKCSIYNLDNAQTTYPQNLQERFNQKVIMHVREVLNDTLIVTFYEGENGEKITLVEPDLATYPRTQTFLRHPVMSSTMYGWISYVDGENIFVQPNECLEDLRLLQEEMANFYDNVQEDLGQGFPAQMFMYAFKDDDDFLWHRVMALEDATDEDKYVSVQFVDNGKVQSLPISALRDLVPDFIRVESMCVTFNVPSCRDPFHDIGEDRNVIIRGIRHSKGKGCYEALSIEGRGEPLPMDTQPTEQIYLDDSHILVNISHVDTPNEFYIQKFQEIDTINDIQARLQEEIPNMPELETPAAGVLCAAPYSVDEQWYRAEVLDADADITTVRFVDYGNTDVLSNDSVKVRTLPSDLLQMAVHATRSSLKIVSVDEEWSPAATEALSELIDCAGVSIKFVEQDEKTNYVELYKDGQSIKDLLLQRNLAIDCAPPEEDGNTGFISHINSPSEFFIQLECYSSELERFSEQLSDAESFPELEDFSPGSLCAAMYLDEQWYRARILSNTVAGIEVLYIDFGNSSVSNHLRQLPEDLVIPPPLAQKCSLKKPDGLMYWSPQANEQFQNISADGQTVFTVEKLSTGETSTVRLLLNGEDILNQLLPETVEGQLVNVESLESFDAIINGETCGKFRLESPPGIVWTNDSYKKFLEFCKSGETKFQIEYVTTDTVRLYIHEKDIRLELGGVKQASLIGEEIVTNENENAAELVDNAGTSIIDSSISQASDSNTSAKDSTSSEVVEASKTELEQGRDIIESEVNNDDNVNIVTGSCDNVSTDDGKKDVENILSCDIEIKEINLSEHTVVTSTPSKMLGVDKVSTNDHDKLEENDNCLKEVVDDAEKLGDAEKLDGTVKTHNLISSPLQANCEDFSKEQYECTVKSLDLTPTSPVEHLLENSDPSQEGTKNSTLSYPNTTDVHDNLEENDDSLKEAVRDLAEKLDDDVVKTYDLESLKLSSPSTTDVHDNLEENDSLKEAVDDLAEKLDGDIVKTHDLESLKLSPPSTTNAHDNLEENDDSFNEALDDLAEKLDDVTVKTHDLISSPLKADSEEAMTGDFSKEQHECPGKSLDSSCTSPMKDLLENSDSSPERPKSLKPSSPSKTHESDLSNPKKSPASDHLDKNTPNDTAESLNKDMVSILKDLVENSLDGCKGSPQASPTRKIKNYDDKIVPAALSRPQSPLPSESDEQTSDVQSS